MIVEMQISGSVMEYRREYGLPKNPDVGRWWWCIQGRIGRRKQGRRQFRILVLCPLQAATGTGEGAGARGRSPAASGAV